MEVIDNDKPSQWSSILKKFRKPKIKTKKSELKSEKSQFTEQEIVDEKDTNPFEETDPIVEKKTNYLEEQGKIIENDINYLEEQDKKLEEFVSTKESIEDKTLPRKIKRYISIIKNLHQRKFLNYFQR